MREEINNHLENLESWIDEERNLVQFSNHQALTYQQLTLAHHSMLEGLIASWLLTFILVQVECVEICLTPVSFQVVVEQQN